MTRVIAPRAVLAEANQQNGWPNADVLQPFASSFEMMAAHSKEISPRVGQMLGILLDAARPSRCGGRAVLHPLWSAEAIHRACSMVHLVVQLQRTAESQRQDHDALWLDHTLANDLAALLNELDIGRDEETLPCANVLRSVVRSLVALFGSCAGGVVIRTDIGRVSLPAYKRRALVLAASELVVNALRHSFADRCGGQIEVTLREFGTAHACLTVANDGVGYHENRPTDRRGIAGALAELLEADLVYRRFGIVGTHAEILFPTYKRISAAECTQSEKNDCMSGVHGSVATAVPSSNTSRRTGRDQSIGNTLVQ